MRAIRIMAACMAGSLGAGCGVFDSPLLKACENTIKERLASPSSYKRIAADETSEPMSRDAYSQYLKRLDYDNQTRETLLTSFDMGLDKYHVHQLTIEYDAPNAYGTPIRSFGRCTYETKKMPRDPKSIDVKLNGKTQTEWLISQIKN